MLPVLFLWVKAWIFSFVLVTVQGTPTLALSLGFQTYVEPYISVWMCLRYLSPYCSNLSSMSFPNNQIYCLPAGHILVRFHPQPLTFSSYTKPFVTSPCPLPLMLMPRQCHLALYFFCVDLFSISSAAILVLDLTIFQLGICKKCHK